MLTLILSASYLLDDGYMPGIMYVLVPLEMFIEFLFLVG